MVQLLAQSAQGVDLIKILPFAAFGLFAAVAWFILDWIASRKSRSEERLDELRDPARFRHENAQRRGASNAMTKVLEKATPALAKPLAPKNEKEASQLKRRLSHAGFRHESAPTIFLGMKIAGLMTGLFLGGATAMLTGGFNQSGFMKLFLFAGGLFYLPEMIVWFLASKRKQSIFLGLPDALDLMVVCVESGLGLDQAMRKVSEEMKKSYRVIAEEFGLSNMQLQMGRSRSEVLTELGHRSGVDDLRALSSIIIQADKFGSSIAQALRVQSESMRTRRRQIAEEKAAKTAVQLIFPLVLFIFPGIFVILVGPAAITMVNEMLPAMGGR